MDIKEIQELIKFVAKSGATEVNLEIDNVKISIKSPAKKGAVPETTIIQQIPVAQSPTAVIPTLLQLLLLLLLQQLINQRPMLQLKLKLAMTKNILL